MRSLVDDFKPIAGRVRLTAKAAYDYTKRPEVTATLPVASESEQMLRRKGLAAVERAEARLAAGTVGLSIESGRPIPDDRLEAVPTAERTAEEEAR
jgi:RNA polymerase-binding transcription factor DksA